MTRFSEFPQPGDLKKHSLPLLVDYEALNTQLTTTNDNQKDKVPDTQLKEFWMPDRFCKVCYGCEEAFTMYRRRHHCRMCGQIFCNNCSSFYIDGMLFNIPGLVRACRLCYDQLFERTESENRLARRKLLDKMSQGVESAAETVRPSTNSVSVSQHGAHKSQQDHSPEGDMTSVNLQNR